LQRPFQIDDLTVITFRVHPGHCGGPIEGRTAARSKTLVGDTFCGRGRPVTGRHEERATMATADESDERESSAGDADRRAAMERLRFYRSEVGHESGLLSGRLNAYITSQSFLIIAFTLFLVNVDPARDGTWIAFPIALAALGFSLSLQAKPGIDGPSDIVRLWLEKQNRLLASHPALDDFRVKRPVARSRAGAEVDVIHERSLFFARWAPRTFLVAWPVFALLALRLAFAA